MKADAFNWFALTVVPQKEFMAETILRRLGVAAFVPVEYKWPRASRKRKRSNIELQPRAYPLFGSRYVWAGFSDVLPMHQLHQLHIITGVVSVADKPAQFPAPAIEYLMQQSGVNIPWRWATNPHKSFKSGDVVEVVQGPFAGHTLPIQKINGNFATVLFDLLGKTQPIDILLDYLEAA